MGGEKQGKYYTLFESSINKFVAAMLDGYKPRKVIDDKIIRDAIFGFNIFYKHEINIIDSPVMQRLRRICQTSLAFHTYPSATHSRFEHSLNCVGLAEKVLESVARKKPEFARKGTPTWAEVRLAALLHDCGHGPFSHASEEFLEEFDEFERLKDENPSLFKRAQPHEILSYFIVKSKPFKELLWRPIIRLYTSKDGRFCDLSAVKFDRVALMIIGKEHPDKPEHKYLTQIVNGPFDIDKLDYLLRDGYFTGLQTAVDIDRLFFTLDVREETRELCTDISGVTALEQLMFCKMLLFSCVYHHHKIRAGVVCLKDLFELIRREKYKLDGLSLDSPFGLLYFDDYDVCNSLHDIPEVNERVHLLRNRILPRRALVIMRDTLKDEESWARLLDFGILGDSRDIKQIADFQSYLRKKIREITGEEYLNVYFDVPDPPRFRRTAFDTIVRVAPNRYIRLRDIYPTGGWVRGYAEYRYRVYIFCSPGQEKQVGEVCYHILSKSGIRLNDLAFLLAKQEDSLIYKLFPKVSRGH